MRTYTYIGSEKSLLILALAVALPERRHFQRGGISVFRANLHHALVGNSTAIQGSTHGAHLLGLGITVMEA